MALLRALTSGPQRNGDEEPFRHVSFRSPLTVHTRSARAIMGPPADARSTASPFKDSADG